MVGVAETLMSPPTVVLCRAASRLPLATRGAEARAAGVEVVRAAGVEEARAVVMALVVVAARAQGDEAATAQGEEVRVGAVVVKAGVLSLIHISQGIVR